MFLLKKFNNITIVQYTNNNKYFVLIKSSLKFTHIKYMEINDINHINDIDNTIA